MPPKMWRTDAGLIQQVISEPYRFQFFQAVRLLLLHQRRHSGQSDDVILEKVIRFRNSISLAFPPSEIESIELELELEQGDKEPEEGLPRRAADAASTAALRPTQIQANRLDAILQFTEAQGVGRFRKITLTPAFMGLIGPSGVLPRHYTQHAADRSIYYRDSTTRAFLDIFTSRAVSLFYKSWLKYRIHLQYEADRKNRFVPLMLSLGGIGYAGVREKLSDGGEGIADETLAFYVAAIRERPRSAQWFARVVADYFRVQAVTTEFVGQWLDLPLEERTRLGTHHAKLGESAFCGSRIWDRQSRIGLRLGPMRLAQYLQMLPGSPGHRNLSRLFRLMQGLTYDCEVRLILDKRDISGVQLQGHRGEARLGWVSWMKPSDEATDSDDTAYILGVEHGFD